jgi:hypothetical protein
MESLFLIAAGKYISDLELDSASDLRLLDKSMYSNGITA